MTYVIRFSLFCLLVVAVTSRDVVTAQSAAGTGLKAMENLVNLGIAVNIDSLISSISIPKTQAKLKADLSKSKKQTDRFKRLMTNLDSVALRAQ